MALPNFLTPLPSALTPDGNYPSANGIEVRGPNLFSVWGTFGSATVKIQFSPDDGATWIDIPSASWTAAIVQYAISLPNGGRIRANISGGTAAQVQVACGPIPQ